MKYLYRAIIFLSLFSIFAVATAVTVPPLVYKYVGCVTDSSGQPDQGSVPAIAATSDGRVVEVHQSTGDNSNLWYSVGELSSNNHIIWHTLSDDKGHYDNGFNPSVAVTPDSKQVVEVHSGSYYKTSSIWYKMGNLNSDNTITWGDTVQLGSVQGAHPSVIIFNDLLQKRFVIVLSYAAEGNTINYCVGVVGSNNTVWWNSEQEIPNFYTNDNMGNSMVALYSPYDPTNHTIKIIDLNSNGWTITGTFNSDRLAINWYTNSLAVADSGTDFKIAAGGFGGLIEVHKSSDRVNNLWVSVGTLHQDDTIWWWTGDYQNYNFDIYPQITSNIYDKSGNPLSKRHGVWKILEMHVNDYRDSNLMYGFFTLNGWPYF